MKRDACALYRAWHFGKQILKAGGHVVHPKWDGSRTAAQIRTGAQPQYCNALGLEAPPTLLAAADEVIAALIVAVRESANGRYCCKSLFALLIKNSPGCRRDFRVKMWGTSSPDDKLTGDLGNVIEATQIGGRRSDRLMAGKLSPGNFGLLQQYRHEADRSR
jgi:hypothetical protein